MADATRNFPNSQAPAGPASELLFPRVTIDSGVTLYQGVAVFRDPADSMKLKSAGASGNPQWIPYGVSSVKQVGDDVLQAELTHGPHVFDNASSGDAIPATLPMGWPLYAKDNRTASLTNGAGLYPLLGWFGGMTGESTSRPIVWVGFCPFAISEVLIPFVKGHADLTDNDTSQDFTLYTLPGPCRVLHAPVIDSLTVFTGGGATAVTVAIGADSDPDAVGDEQSIFTGGAAGAMTAGVLGYPGALLAAGTVIKAQFVTDATLLGLTTGAIVGHIRLRAGS